MFKNLMSIRPYIFIYVHKNNSPKCPVTSDIDLMILLKMIFYNLHLIAYNDHHKMDIVMPLPSIVNKDYLL